MAADSRVQVLDGSPAGREAEVAADSRVQVQVQVLVRLRRDAAASADARDAGAVRVEFPGGQATCRGQAGQALLALTAGDVPVPDVPAPVLRRLDSAGLLEHVVCREGRELARLRPVGRGFPDGAGFADGAGAGDGALGADGAPGGEVPVKLSRFAAARAEGGRLVLAGPDGHRVVDLAPAAAAVLGVLADWVCADEVGRLVPGGTEVLALLAAAGLLVAGGPGGDPEQVCLEQAQWSLPDLWMHTRSRDTRLSAGYGATYPMASRFAALPAEPPPRPGPRVELPVPDLALIAKQDPPFTAVLEGRRSVREHDQGAPITVAALGELLYRSVRIRRRFPGGHGQVLLDRPYPSGGAIHELEVYPLVTRCAGLDPGLWHYASDGHCLERVAEPGPSTAALVARASWAGLMAADPQVLLVITARFGRLMWKYDTISYALLLKHVGVLYQTVYLVCTAMGLAVCGLGGGDAADFAAASGLDRLAEGSVGEIAVGSRPPAGRAPRLDPLR